MNPRVVVLLFALVALVAAFATTMLVRERDPAPESREAIVKPASPAPIDAHVESGTTHSTTTREPDAEAEPVPAATASADGEPFSIEIRDDAGSAVEGVTVTVSANGEPIVTRKSSPAGLVNVNAPQDFADLANWTIAASLPGRVVTRPFLPFSRPSVVTVAMGSVGELRVRCVGATGVLQLTVTGSTNGVGEGGDATALAMRDGTYTFCVPAGAHEFVVASALGFVDVSKRVVGPRSQGDVVDVQLQFETCRLTGRFPADTHGTLWIIMVERDAVRGFGVATRPDHTFAVDLPRSPMATVSIVRARECALVPRTSFTTDAEDVGELTFVERPRFGSFDVRDGNGVPVSDLPPITSVTTTYGTRPEKGSFPMAVYLQRTPGKGIEVFGVPGLVAVEVAPTRREMFCVPETLTIRDGGTFQAVFVEGAKVVVRATQAGPRSLHEVQLVADTGGKRFPSVAARLDGDIQRYTFRGLPPGVYRVECKGLAVIGGTVTVLAGASAEVDVTLAR